MQIPVLETERLSIRPLTAADHAACHALFVEIGWADIGPDLLVRDDIDGHLGKAGTSSERAAVIVRDVLKALDGHA